MEQIAGAVAGGIDLVQIRETDLYAGDLVRLVVDVASVCRGTATRVVVNDRVDVAVAAAADGVHLREASFGVDRARILMPSAFVGRSIHSSEGAVAAGAVDYLIAGTVLPTVAKSSTTHFLGFEGLASVVRAVPDVPVLAIGGMTAEHAADVIGAGAHGLAGVGVFLPSPGSTDVAQDVQEIVKNCRFRFDSISAVP